MFNTMNFAIGMVLAKDMPENRDKIMTGLVAAQFPAGNLFGPVLLKPTLVDTATELGRTRTTLSDRENELAKVTQERDYLERRVAGIDKIIRGSGITNAGDIDNLDKEEILDGLAKVDIAMLRTALKVAAGFLP
jgi:hypothetical protein